MTCLRSHNEWQIQDANTGRGALQPLFCSTPSCLLKMLTVANTKSSDYAVIKSLQPGAHYSFMRLLSGFPKKLLTGGISERMVGKKAILMKSALYYLQNFWEILLGE